MPSWIPFPPPSPGQFISVPRLSVQPIFTFHTLLWYPHLQAIASTSPCRQEFQNLNLPARLVLSSQSVYSTTLLDISTNVPQSLVKTLSIINSSFPLPVNQYLPLVIILLVLANDTTYPETCVTLGFFHFSYLRHQVSILPPKYRSACTSHKSSPMPMISKSFSLTFITEKIFEHMPKICTYLFIY